MLSPMRSGAYSASVPSALCALRSLGGSRPEYLSRRSVGRHVAAVQNVGGGLCRSLSAPSLLAVLDDASSPDRHRVSCRDGTTRVAECDAELDFRIDENSDHEQFSDFSFDVAGEYWQVSDDGCDEAGSVVFDEAQFATFYRAVDRSASGASEQAISASTADIKAQHSDLVDMFQEQSEYVAKLYNEGFFSNEERQALILHLQSLSLEQRRLHWVASMYSSRAEVIRMFIDANIAHSVINYRPVRDMCARTYCIDFLPPGIAYVADIHRGPGAFGHLGASAYEVAVTNDDAQLQALLESDPNLDRQIPFSDPDLDHYTDADGASDAEMWVKWIRPLGYENGQVVRTLEATAPLHNDVASA